MIELNGGLRSDNEMLLRRVEVKLTQELLNLLDTGKIIQRWSDDQVRFLSLRNLFFS